MEFKTLKKIGLAGLAGLILTNGGCVLEEKANRKLIEDAENVVYYSQLVQNSAYHPSCLLVCPVHCEIKMPDCYCDCYSLPNSGNPRGI